LILTPRVGGFRRLGLLAAILAAACAAAPTPAVGGPTPTTFPPTSATISSLPTTSDESPVTATPRLQPTPDATALIESVMAHSGRHSLATLASPDGQWRVESVRSDCTPNGGDSLAYEQLLLHRMDTGEARVIADQLINCGGLGASGLDPRYWSSDSRYLFYTPAREGRPDGGGCGPWYRPIVRLDIRGGEKIDLAEGVPSPDGALIAGYQVQEVIVWGRDVSDVIRAAAPETTGGFGPLAWAPDGKALVYLHWEAGCPQSGKSIVVRLDLPTGAQTLLLESATPSFVDLAWDTSAALRLTDVDGQAWVYDLSAKTLTRASS
jgi:hypothetical protein